MRGDCCRKVRASVESSPGELVVGDIGRSSVERFCDYFVFAAEFLLHDIRPAVDRKPHTGGIRIWCPSPRKGIAEDHDSNRLSKTGTDKEHDGNQTEKLLHRLFLVEATICELVFEFELYILRQELYDSLLLRCGRLVFWE